MQRDKRGQHRRDHHQERNCDPVSACERLGGAEAEDSAENRSPDYSLTLGQIAKTQAAIGAGLEAMEGHPALRLTPVSFGGQVERAVTNACPLRNPWYGRYDERWEP